MKMTNENKFREQLQVFSYFLMDAVKERQKRIYASLRSNVNKVKIQQFSHKYNQQT